MGATIDTATIPSSSAPAALIRFDTFSALCCHRLYARRQSPKGSCARVGNSISCARSLAVKRRKTIMG
ncbi:hypothetical protein QR680_007147 [Steinernema hermaphroditum]|uniref:Uncharacterized protein n=1 Tax=Steinernema hermaphroditum TaxID=289476 RepID=A0AA39HXR9_9BILA|nr:hypothetical protein QR680_007147 [Steinernema hermaphroditum]